MKTKPAKPEISDVQVWNANDSFGLFTGFLVTEPGDINKPVAFVFYDHGGVAGDMLKAMALAQDISEASDFEAWERPWHPSHVLDLRPYGKPDSQRPMPAFIYSLRCFPTKLESACDGDDLPECLDYRDREPRPFCLFLLDEITKHKR